MTIVYNIKKVVICLGKFLRQINGILKNVNKGIFKPFYNVYQWRLFLDSLNRNRKETNKKGHLL
ncbi:hypothetical protein DMZ48_12920 [Robertkochia solimangrovi]|nr:hypothetical protein DMZ48_12920 [Robertkochia solimangrovi]